MRQLRVDLDDRFDQLFNENAALLSEVLGVRILDASSQVRMIEAQTLFTNIILKELKRRPRGASSFEAVRNYIFSRKAWRKQGTRIVDSVAPIYEAFNTARDEIEADMQGLQKAEEGVVAKSEMA